jgi:serine/threonine protein kinase
MSAQLSSESIIPRASDPDIDHDSASSNHRLSKILSERKMQASPDTVVSLDSRSSQSWNLDDLNLIAVLGRGIFGKVMLAEHKQAKEVFACKVLKKARVVENDEVATTRIERDVLKRCTADKHPFIAQFVASFQTETRLIFVMEYCPGGDLMFLLQRGPFGTPRSKLVLYQCSSILRMGVRLTALDFMLRSSASYLNTSMTMVFSTEV